MKINIRSFPSHSREHTVSPLSFFIRSPSPDFLWGMLDVDPSTDSISFPSGHRRDPFANPTCRSLGGPASCSINAARVVEPEWFINSSQLCFVILTVFAITALWYKPSAFSQRKLCQMVSHWLAPMQQPTGNCLSEALELFTSKAISACLPPRFLNESIYYIVGAHVVWCLR